MGNHPHHNYPRLTRCIALPAVLGGLALAAPALATEVEQGSEIILEAGSSFFADCDDVVVNGTISMAPDAMLNLNSLTIGPTGVLNGGGTIHVAASWNKNSGGSFNAGNSTVYPGGTCGNSSTVFTGNSSFNNFIVGNHAIVLTAGTTQTVSGQLGLNGTPVRSSAASQIAYLNLLPAGTQNITGVTVNDVYATGQWLAAGQNNGTGGNNANRWFGTGEAAQPIVPVPATGLLTLLLTGLALVIGAGCRKRLSLVKRGTTDTTSI